MSQLYEIVFTVAAEHDMAEADDYLFMHGSPAIAEQKLAQIIDRVDALRQFPDRGSIPSDLKLAARRGIRQIVVGRYRILYRVTREKVIVFLVSDGRRDMQALLRRRLITPPGSPR